MIAAADAPQAWAHPAAAYPEAVRAELARRREQILARAQGRVLDLDDPATFERFATVGHTSFTSRATPSEAPIAPVADEPRYDTVVATGVLAGFADLAAVIGALAALVADDGALLFVEPVGVPGWSHIAAVTLGGLGRRGEPWRALHLDRDVPATVRTAGLVVCDLDRGELPAQPRSLRHWVSGRAVRIVAA